MKYYIFQRVRMRAYVRAVLLIQHATRMGHTLTSSVASGFIFSTLSQKRNDFRKKKKVIEYKMCFHLLYNFCIEHFSSLEEFRKTLS